MAGDHITLPATAGPIEVATELVDFVGEFRLRLWNEELPTDPLSLWLPSWIDG